MGKRIFCVVLLFLLGLNNIAEAETYDEIIQKFFAAVDNLKTCKITGETLTRIGEVETEAELDGKIDLANERAFFHQKMRTEGPDGIVTREVDIYLMEDDAYVKEEGRWVKSQMIGEMMWGMIEKLRGSEFREFERWGLRGDIVGDEVIDGENCYVISQVVKDPERFREYLKSFIHEGLPQGAPTPLIENLEVYSMKWLISKDTYLTVKASAEFGYTFRVGPKSNELIDVTIEQNARYFDHNKPVEIELPEEALFAEELK